MAKKKKNASATGSRPAAAQPANKQELRQQRLEKRREEKAAREAARRRAAQRERLVRLGVIALLVGVFFWFVFLRNQRPSEINGNVVEELSAAGVGDHVSGTVNYESAPPVSGAHAQGSAPCGVHNQPVPNENQVHSLEHGAVALQYKPGEVAVEDIRRLEKYAERYDDYILVAPYPNMETPVAVSAWSYLMRLSEVDTESIQEFIEEFRGEGPEPNQPCPNTANQPYEEPQPEATPSPGATDGAGGGTEGSTDGTDAGDGGDGEDQPQEGDGSPGG